MLYLTCLFLVLASLILEQLWLRRGRGKVPVRIHVHGTRGKSTIVRELAAILRTRGLLVLAKTTGDRPEYILPDGETTPVRRVGPPRIQEHINLLHKALSMGVDVMVVEGMALQPETVYMSEKMLQSTHAVIANTRPDHAETMGAGREGVLQTLQHMIPCSGKLFISDEAGADFLTEQASRKRIACSVVKGPVVEQPLVMARAVADEVLPEKIPYRRSGTVFYSMFSSPVALTFLKMPVYVHDFLSANDVVSSQMMLEKCILRKNLFCVALFATRSDRPLRTRDFINWILAEPRFDAVAVMGSHAGYALLRGVMGKGCNQFLCVRPGLSPVRLLRVMRKKALEHDRKGLTVVALGNAHGYGEKWRGAIQHFTVLSPGNSRETEQNKGEEHAD